VKDLQSWIAKRIPWRNWGHKVEVNGQRYVLEIIAAGLFRERQQTVQKLARERARRRAAEARRDAPTFDRLPWEAEAERLAHHWAWNAALRAAGRPAADLSEARKAFLAHIRTAPVSGVPEGANVR
jgi:hypothetical protein